MSVPLVVHLVVLMLRLAHSPGGVGAGVAVLAVAVFSAALFSPRRRDAVGLGDGVGLKLQFKR